VAFSRTNEDIAAVIERQTAVRPGVRNTLKPKISAKSAYSRVRGMKQLSRGSMTRKIGHADDPRREVLELI